MRVADIAPEHAELELGLDRGQARISCARNRPALDRVRISCEGGQTLVYVGSGWLRRIWRRARRPGRVGDLVNLLIGELEEFSRAARGGSPDLLATAADGVAVMSALDAARCSADAGGSWHPVRSLVCQP